MDSVNASERYRRVRSLSQAEPSANRVVDWSYRQLKTLHGLQCLADTQHLILDGNSLERLQLPFMPFLMTLSINENKISELDRFCDTLRTSCPSLTHLSMIGNPACPHPLTASGDEEQYTLYRRFILSKLPQLKFLDSTILQPKRLRVQTEPNYAASLPFRHRYESVNRAVHSILHRIGLADQNQKTDSDDDANNNNNDFGFKSTQSKSVVKTFLPKFDKPARSTSRN